jgi:hypothetical protein
MKYETEGCDMEYDYAVKIEAGAVVLDYEVTARNPGHAVYLAGKKAEGELSPRSLETAEVTGLRKI